MPFGVMHRVGGAAVVGRDHALDQARPPRAARPAASRRRARAAACRRARPCASGRRPRSARLTSSSTDASGSPVVGLHVAVDALEAAHRRLEVAVPGLEAGVFVLAHCLKIVEETVDTSTLASYIAQAIVYASTVAAATQEELTVSSPTAPNQPPGRLARLADFAFRRRRLVVLGWIAALVVAFGAASQLGGEFTADYGDARAPSRRPPRTGWPIASPRRLRSRSTSSGRRDDAASRDATERVGALLAERAATAGHRRRRERPRRARSRATAPIGVVRLPLSVANVDDVPIETGEELIAMVDAREQRRPARRGRRPADRDRPSRARSRPRWSASRSPRSCCS